MLITSSYNQPVHTYIALISVKKSPTSPPKTVFKRKKIKSLLYFVSCFTPFANISGGSGSEDTFKPRGAWMCILTFLFHTTNDLWMGPVPGVHLAYLFLEDENQVTLTKKDCFPEQCHYLDVQRIATLGCPVDTFFSLHLKLYTNPLSNILDLEVKGIFELKIEWWHR